MQIDWHPFLVNKLDLENLVVLIRPEQADTTKGKDVVIGEPRLKRDAKSTPSSKVVMVKKQSRLPSGVLQRVATQAKSKDQLRLIMKEGGG
jgi:hypothetical protein